MVSPLRIPDERTLDICLLKQKKRPKVQKYGTIAFEGEIYKGDCLLGKENQQVDYENGLITKDEILSIAQSLTHVRNRIKFYVVFLKSMSACAFSLKIVVEGK